MRGSILSTGKDEKSLTAERHIFSCVSFSGLLRAGGRGIRYRFFLLAGVFPYLLGAAVAYHTAGTVEGSLLFIGLAAIVFASIGIEGMNEYFDARIGGDRVFAWAERMTSWWHLPLGIAGFALALGAAVYLSILRGWMVLGFAFVGAALAFSYLVPPVHLSYRGLGEAVIALGYGPGLTMGSFYLQTGRLDWKCLAVSLLPALFVFAMSLANEIPDYYGDRLVGKKNLIVRMGQRRGVLLYGAVLGLAFAVMAGGLITGIFPLWLGIGFALLPLGWRNLCLALKFYQTAAKFLPVIQGTILLYVLGNTVAICCYLL